jgi:ribosomal protein L12E/L44/L45/RPP1/RPP2
VLDFTHVKEGGGSFTKKRVKAGDYLCRITKFEVTEVKKGENKGNKQWLFTLAIEGRHGATYPYYCQLEENVLWKIRNLLVAAGINVPKKKVKVKPKVLIGKLVGVTLDDAEYDGREQSEVTAVFPASEVEGASARDASDDDDDEDEDEETGADEEEEEDEEPAPKKSKKSKKSKKAPEPDEDDEDDEDEDEPEPPKKKSKKAAVDDDEDEDEEEDDEPEPPKKSKKKASKKKADDDEDEDLDELDIEDL